MADPAELAVWVYGVAAGDLPELPPCAGVDGHHDARLIRHAGLAAIVSEVPLAAYHEGALRESLEDLDWLERVARAHERVLDVALAVGPVVPFRICTIYETPGHVREMLEAAGPVMDETLARLRGAAEWGVKAYLADADTASEDATAGAPGSGVAYLARKREAREAQDAGRRAAEAALQAIHTGLRRHAIEAVLRPPQDRRLSGHDADMVLNAAYLVADHALEAFRARFYELVLRHAATGLTLELTGPWPAYHFACAPTPSA